MKGQKLHSLFIILACLALSTSAQADGAYHRTSNIVYQEREGVGLVLDVFAPQGDRNGLAIIDTLSGAWHSEQAQVDDHLEAGIFDTYCSRGYTVFMIRPGSRTLFTALEMRDNLQTGIRWVKAHAGEYGIDPERIGITGASAGGHLTLLALVNPKEGEPNAKDPLKEFDTRVAAAAVFFPPADFLDYRPGEESNFQRIADIFFREGLKDKSEEEILDRAREISPAHNVNGKLPPVLLIHGDADDRVPLSHSEKMVKAIEAVEGNIVNLIVKPGGGHPWPTIAEEVAVMADWFDENLVAK